ncbi:LacI family DNA-binding transcriptional regulator [Qipengyuania sp. JC766]|uniref:LacI family DNA-binding transcriptional regulator n=1 Tax=Qipengyuania sp. JC766 TaxID=3232139 RepID=UPI00345A33FD
MDDGKRDVGRRVTSFDVAERAGVSQSTVSRALAGSPQITPQTRARVTAVAQELGYLVDHRASRLRTGRTDTIAVVILGRPEDATRSANPFYFELLGSICEAASQRGLEVLVSLQSEEGEFFGDYVGRGQADGVIVVGSARNTRAWTHFRELQEASPRVVFWGSPFDDAGWVRSDNFAGGRLAVRHLLEHGYRRIAFVGPLEERLGQFQERFDGYAAELAAHKMEPVFLPSYDALDRYAQGSGAAAALMERDPRIDAVFAASDQLAFGVLEYLQSHGIAVPDEIGLVGFDGMAAGTICSPALTTVAPDLRKAAAMLLDAMDGTAGPSSERVPVELIERASVRARKA